MRRISTQQMSAHLLTHLLTHPFIPEYSCRCVCGSGSPSDAPESGWRQWGREALATLVVLYKLSVDVGGGNFKVIQPLARPPGDASTFWR